MNETYEVAVERIQRAALETLGDNVIPTELSYQQALSIYLRSAQLCQEGFSYGKNMRKRKTKEVDICWKKQRR